MVMDALPVIIIIISLRLEVHIEERVPPIIVLGKNEQTLQKFGSAGLQTFGKNFCSRPN